MKPRVVIALSALTCIATVLYAHDLFVKLETYFLKPYSSVRIPILNGTFNSSENSIARDRVTAVSLASHTTVSQVPTATWNATGDTTYLTIETGMPGTYVFGVATRPRDFELKASSFNEYLEHDGIPDVLAMRERDGELDKDVRERYSKHVKAVFQVGRERTDDYGKVLGYPAEIVPLDNPYSLHPGSELRVRCLVDGRPVTGQLVLAGGEHGGNEIRQRDARTDNNGVATFRLDSPGRWYVKFINMVPSNDGVVDYESKWATLTFEIR
ncbi:MAG: DUF4198 domain-containing protein [Gemmatimonadales bacterium]